jgi:hypothetical protein
MQYRRTLRIDKAELKEWKKILDLYGAKAHCSRATGINRMTLYNIIYKRGRGDEVFIGALKKYFAQLKEVAEQPI